MSDNTPQDPQIAEDEIKEDIKFSEVDEVNKLKDLLDLVANNAHKGLEGNKQAARRARKALNEIKKVCTPLRLKIQEAVKG